MSLKELYKNEIKQKLAEECKPLSKRKTFELKSVISKAGE
jgi:ribosomal protein S17